MFIYFKNFRDFFEFKDLDIGSLSKTERVIFWTAVLTPLWWLLGIQPLFYPFVLICVLIANFSFEKLIHSHMSVCPWAWLFLAIVMLWTMLLGLYDMEAGLGTIAAAFVTFFKSYLMIFSCLAIPFLSEVRIQVITRAVVVMSLGCLVNLCIQMPLLALGINGNKYEALGTLMSTLTSSGDALSMTITLPVMQNFFGIPMPRTVLHTADPPILGCCAILFFLISLTETNDTFRKWALISSFLALVISFSRSSWIGFVIALFIIICFRSRKLIQLPLWLSGMAFFISTFLGTTVTQLLEKPQEIFDSARADSSLERAKVVQATLDAWLDKPWLGWGVIRGEAWLYDDVYLSLGSFATYQAILYLNGIVGFTAFILTFLVTLGDFLRAGLLEDSFECQIAFSGYLILIALIYATPLSWMAIYLWYFFLWSGAALRDAVYKEKMLLAAS